MRCSSQFQKPRWCWQHKSRLKFQTCKIIWCAPADRSFVERPTDIASKHFFRRSALANNLNQENQKDPKTLDALE
jgi:hypothetical protein